MYCYCVSDDVNDANVDGCDDADGVALSTFRCVSDTAHSRRSSASGCWVRAVDLALTLSPNSRTLRSEDYLVGVIVLLYS